jgi:hypothetical protein
MRRLSNILCAAALAGAGLTAPAGAATTIVVSAQSNIFAAGLSSIPLAPGGEGSLPPSLAVLGGDTLSIAVTGAADPSGGYGTHGPDGFALTSNITNATGSSVGNFTSSSSLALLGVFLGSGSGVDTVFTIGSGGSFVVPTGATALYLGFADSYGFNGPSSYYGDNSGGFSAEISAASENVGAVPEPATWAMMIIGFGAVGAAMRRRRLTVTYA